MSSEFIILILVFDLTFTPIKTLFGKKDDRSCYFVRANSEKKNLVYYAVEDEVIMKNWISLEEGIKGNCGAFRLDKGSYSVRDLADLGSSVAILCDDRKVRLCPKIQFDAKSEMDKMFSG